MPTSRSRSEAHPSCGVSVPRRRLLAGAGALAAAPLAGAVRAQDKYPSKPIRFVIPYTAGSVGDLFIRPVAQMLGQSLGEPIICDNRPGASQAIGAEQAARAAPDGYTFFMGTQSGLVLNTLARKKLPYDPIKDFAPVTMLFTAPLYLFLNPAIPAKNVQELIALAKAQPGKLTFASIGPGTSSHLAGEMFKTRAGIDMLHVPYRGGPEATTALVAGQVDIMFNGGNTLPQLKRGNVKVLALGSIKRTKAMPDVPTLDELGIKGFDVSPWFALFAPAGTPRALIDRINGEIVEIVKDPAIQDKALSLSLEIETGTPEQLGQRLKDDFPVWGKVMKQAGIEPE